jgi:ribosomal protein S18 acetylase RimI-like enzyme
MHSCKQDLVIRLIRPTDAAVLGDFFEIIGADAESARFFHPHPLTPEYAALLCGSAPLRRDRHYLVLYENRPVAYMLLRGWDEGYAVPSWGGCVHPELRSAGLGHALLAHAVAECRAVGAAKLRLTVHKANQRGIHLYAKFGFVFENKDARSDIGLLDLTGPLTVPAIAPDTSRLRAWLEHSRLQAAA